jgi:hypothetical protein
MSATVVAGASVCAAAAYVVLNNRAEWQAPVLRAFTVLLLTMLPALLYLRFVRQRLTSLSTEYVYNLHRLRVDSPGYLPRPPASSKFHERWENDGGHRGRGSDNIYRQKFQNQYGRWPRDDGEDGTAAVGSLLPVHVCTAVVGAGTAAAVWHPPAGPSVSTLHGSLVFGFLGAYFFVLSALTRRYFQNDLRPGAYLAASVRIITVLLLVAAAVPLLERQGLPRVTTHATAFMIGVVPTVALQLLRRSVGRLSGWARGGVEPPFPLDQLDGVDIWTEARLLEVGIEDVQHLASANLVDVSLTTRIPMQRVVDWVDQALLLLHAGLPRNDNAERSTYRELRAVGVRTATDLLVLVECLGLDLKDRTAWPTADDRALGGVVRTDAGSQPSGHGVGLLTRAALIAGMVAKEPNYTLVRNWQLDGDPPAGDAGVPTTARPL